MKSKVVTAVLLSSVVLLAGSARIERSHLGCVGCGGVGFSLGEGWTCAHAPSSPGLYPIRLVGRAGMVRVILLPPELADPKAAATGLRATFEDNPAAIPGSFIEQPFVTDSALRGLHVQFRQRSQQEADTAEIENHHYFVRNQQGRCVAVHFQPGQTGEAEAVDRMIRNTLHLQ